MSTTTTSCPTCGKPLPADAPMGICPDCLLQAGFGTVTGVAKAQRNFQPPPPEELAARFPQLEILTLLGRGGMGAVYKARQKRLDRVVALKILPPGIAEGAAFAVRFEREAKALAKLHHPHIVTLYEFGEADGLYYFLMEFVDGVTLRDLLLRGSVAPREALAIVPQICDALQFAHDRGIVHRDIKPENILLNKDGQVKIADFGVAKIIAETVEMTTGTARAEEPLQTEAGVLGTPSYMAPEQIAEPGAVDHRADIYALGVVFYQMLTGELPGKRLEPPSKKVSIDVRLDEVVLRALEKSPELRYQQVSVFKTEVETIVSDSKKVEGERPGLEIEPSRFSRAALPGALGSGGKGSDVRQTRASEGGGTRLGKWALGLLLVAMGMGLTCWDAVNETFLMFFVGAVTLIALFLGVRDWRNRLGKIAAVGATLWLAGWLVFTVGFFSPIGSLHRYTHQHLYPRLQIPKDYKGLLVLVSAVPGNPELPIRGEKQVLRFPADGMLLTSDTPRFGLGATRTIETYDPASGNLVGGREMACHFESHGEVTTPDGARFQFTVYEVGDAAYSQRKQGPTDAATIKQEAKRRVMNRLAEQNRSPSAR